MGRGNRTTGNIPAANQMAGILGQHRQYRSHDGIVLSAPDPTQPDLHRMPVGDMPVDYSRTFDKQGTRRWRVTGQGIASSFPSDYPSSLHAFVRQHGLLETVGYSPTHWRRDSAGTTTVFVEEYQQAQQVVKALEEWQKAWDLQQEQERIEQERMRIEAEAQRQRQDERNRAEARARAERKRLGIPEPQEMYSENFHTKREYSNLMDSQTYYKHALHNSDPYQYSHNLDSSEDELINIQPHSIKNNENFYDKYEFIHDVESHEYYNR